MDVNEHLRLWGLDRDAWKQWQDWARAHHPLVWAVCDFGEAWVLRCWAYDVKDGRHVPRAECPVHGNGARCCRPLDLVSEEIIVLPPPAGLVERTKRALATPPSLPPRRGPGRRSSPPDPRTSG